MRQRPNSAAVPGGSAGVPRRNSAVPQAKKNPNPEYEVFKKVFEMDVIYTIGKDLEEIANEEKNAELNLMQNRQKRQVEAEEKQGDEAVDRMLQLYFLLPHKPAEEQKDSPSKQAALPPRPGSALKPVEPLQPNADSHQ